MNTRNFPTRTLAAVVAAVLALTASTAWAQDSTATYNSQPVQQPVKLSSPQLSYGVSEVVKLAQAKAADDTILAYVRNSGNSYGLDADQIIYLQQQGVSSAVITAMLNQPKAGMLPPGAPATSAYLPQPSSPAPAPQPDNSAAVSQAPPSVTYVQSAPTSYYYSDPGYYSSSYYYPYSYPYYGGYYGYGYPVIGFGFGYRGGYYRGGYYGGGGWHGGGGGWHGGGGGGGGGGHGGGGGGGHGGGGGGHH